MVEQISAFESVNQFLRTQHSLLLIIGNAGCGKTLLLNKIVAQTHISRDVIRMQGSANIHPSQLIKMLSKHWGTNVTDAKAGLHQQLQQILTSLAKKEQRCSLIIDDAHCLPLSVMAALSHLAIAQENKEILLHIVLSGRPELREKMQHLQVRPIPYLDLEKQEIPHFKIENVEERKQPEFKANNFLLQHKVKIGATLSLAFMCAIMTWYYQRPHVSFEMITSARITHRAQPEDLFKGAMVTQSYEVNSDYASLAESIFDESSNVEANNDSPPRDTAIADSAVKEKNNSSSEIISTAENTLNESDNLAENSDAPSEYIPNAENIPKEKNNTPSKYISSAENILKKSPIAKKHSAPKKAPATIHSAKKMAPHSNHYIIQILSGENKQGIIDYINAHNIREKAKIIDSIYRNKHWFILGYGEYDTVANAKVDIEKFSSEIKKLQPWVRPESTLKLHH